MKTPTANSWKPTRFEPTIAEMDVVFCSPEWKAYIAKNEALEKLGEQFFDLHLEIISKSENPHLAPIMIDYNTTEYNIWKGFFGKQFDWVKDNFEPKTAGGYDFLLQSSVRNAEKLTFYQHAINGNSSFTWIANRDGTAFRPENLANRWPAPFEMSQEEAKNRYNLVRKTIIKPCNCLPFVCMKEDGMKGECQSHMHGINNPHFPK